MEINCPVCSVSIEVTEEHIGRKGRCTNCESKFIIPEKPDGEFEILVRGEIPEEKPQRKVAFVLPGNGRPARRHLPARLQVGQGESPIGVIAFAVVCVAAAIGLAIYVSNTSAPPAARPQVVAAPPAVATIPSPAPRTELPATAPAETTAVELPAAVSPSQPVGQPLAPAEEVAMEPTPALTPEQKAHALTFLQSTQASKRAAAYAGFRKLGERERSSYLESLELAREFHSDALGERANQLAVADNALGNFKQAFDSWSAARDRAKQLVQTNWKEQNPDNYKKRHAEMDDAAEEAAKFYVRATRAAERAKQFAPAGLQDHAAALTEISAEIAWCNDRVADAPLPLREVIAMTRAADAYITAVDQVTEANAIAAGLAEAGSFNAGCSWASGAYQSFAAVLNERRVALGLTPLRLAELLSKSCEAHSADMAANNYFSHSGLTPETKDFGTRARRAGFSGFATGECIFMGSPSALAAHQAWWYSDGHRLIMYADNPNTLGLGLSGNHWTLNTAKQ